MPYEITASYNVIPVSVELPVSFLGAAESRLANWSLNKVLDHVIKLLRVSQHCY